MGRRLIFDSRDLENATAETLKGIDKALLAAAFKIRDDMRTEFKSSLSLYKNGTAKYSGLAEGIMVGKLKNSSVKLHALGSKNIEDSWKARFFVGGTKYRTLTKKAGQSIKPFTKGFIASNDAVEKGLSTGQETLNNYINNTLNK